MPRRIGECLRYRFLRQGELKFIARVIARVAILIFENLVYSFEYNSEIFTPKNLYEPVGQPLDQFYPTAGTLFINYIYKLD